MLSKFAEHKWGCFFVFFPMAVSRLLWLSNLFGEVVGLFLPCKLSDTPFRCIVQCLKCSVPHEPNDDTHTIPLFLKAGASVRCGVFVSFL